MSTKSHSIGFTLPWIDVKRFEAPSRRTKRGGSIAIASSVCKSLMMSIDETPFQLIEIEVAQSSFVKVLRVCTSLESSIYWLWLTNSAWSRTRLEFLLSTKRENWLKFYFFQVQSENKFEIWKAEKENYKHRRSRAHVYGYFCVLFSLFIWFSPFWMKFKFIKL